MNNIDQLNEIAKQYNFDKYSLVGKYKNKNVYYFIHTRNELKDGELIGLPVLYIENDNSYTRLLGNELIEAMKAVFNKPKE